MALKKMLQDLFKRTEVAEGLFAVEKISLLYTLFTSLLIVCLYGQMDHPGTMLLERALIAGMTLLFMYLYRQAPCRLAALVRVVVQIALLSYWYPDTFEFNRVFPNLDHLFAGAEQWLFGGQPAVWFSRACPQFWVSELLNLGYVSYYPMIAVTMLAYFFLRYEQFEKFAFVIVASFFTYYLIFMFVPVAGPQFYFPAIGSDNVANGIFPAIGDYFNHHQELLPGPDGGDGFFHGLVEVSQRVGERPTAAFPSSHVGMATMLMLLAWRVSRRLTFFLSPLYVLLCCATVYIQAHYLIDALVGFFSSFLVYMLTTKAYKWWFA